MPSFYPRTQGSSLPLTPPDSGSAGYGFSHVHYPQEQYVPHQNMGGNHNDGVYDYPHSYMQPAVAPAPPNYQYQSGTFQPANNLPPISSYYEPMGAPTLPPLRMQEHLSFSDDYQRRLQQQEQESAAMREQQRQAAKEDKATGGVSAKLDYEMERMTDFVTKYAQKIFNYTVSSPPSFRKWVHQVLSATRLPSATILLSLHYLSERLATQPGSIKAGEHQINRFLAVSLILGSKFLDDNTFVNKSWSDVTAIKVSELNLLEREWLQLIKYRLHVDPEGGVAGWIEAWNTYDAEQNIKQQAATRLSPLDTNVHRHSSNSNRYSPYPTPYTASPGRSHESLSSRASQYATTPYSSIDTWGLPARSNLSDYYSRDQHYPTLNDIDEANRQATELRRQSQYNYISPAAPASQNYYDTSSYAPAAWYTTAWNSTRNSHRFDCECFSCDTRTYRPYPVASAYAPQTVMG
nr:hypothetical protein B0A51_06152 [Rachicladosporium sp. CCFEE 5018]